mmetsp:Transcript_19631/g.41169  ORF Transcript_19631/g.41169 Transcript_19631/m.41169 type:complete len:473 (+) Transcript_19631:79-1497(+)
MPTPPSTTSRWPFAIVTSCFYFSSIATSSGALFPHHRHEISTTPIFKSKKPHAAFVVPSTRHGWRSKNKGESSSSVSSLFQDFKNDITFAGGSTRQTRVMLFLSASSKNYDDDPSSMNSPEAPKGFEAALAALDALGSLDLDDIGGNGDDGNLPQLEYSRTDDTDLANYGKATVEEAELYLDMKGALEGKITIDEEFVDGVQNSDLEGELEPENIIDEMELLQKNIVDESEELPWESINPILRVRGPVASGYGRGGKKLGVPTANLPASLFQSALEEVQTGVYFGWAVIEQQQQRSQFKKGRNMPLKAVVNVGYSPTFEGKENKEKIVEAHLITDASPMDTSVVLLNNNDDGGGDDGEVAESSISSSSSPSSSSFSLDGDAYTGEIEGDFYNETMRLQLIGFLRPEQKFDSFPELIAQIHRDIGTASFALGSMPFVFSKEDEFISGCSGEDGDIWVGSGGGDGNASWEFEDW